LALIACLLVALGAIFSAYAVAFDEVQAPGWALSATTYPSSLVQGVDAVQVVTVAPEAVSFTVGYEQSQTAPLPAGSTASTVQGALEGLAGIGAGDVAVTEEGAGVYAVKFVGALGDTHVAELEAEGANVAERTDGAASGTIAVDVFNVGAAASTGEITFVDHLPSGVHAKRAGELLSASRGFGGGWGVDPIIENEDWSCTGNGPGPNHGVAGATVVTCTNNPAGLASFAGGGGVPHPRGLVPQPAVGITVEASGEASGLVNHASIAGGGALASASTENEVNVGSAVRPGISGGDVWFSSADGQVDTQAGSHPYAMTTVIDLATITNQARRPEQSGALLRDLEVRLPPGFVGDLRNMPRCTLLELEHGELGACPQSSEVGLLSTQLVNIASPLGDSLFNMVPPKGQAAELGFKLLGVTVLIDFSVRSGGDYGISVHTNNIIQFPQGQVVVVVWGDPGDRSHDIWRGNEGEGCSPSELEQSPESEAGSYCTRPQRRVLSPILRLPTSCEGPQAISLRELSGWEDPNLHSEVNLLTHDSNDQPGGFTGCESLRFEPVSRLLPEAGRADQSIGLTAEVAPALGGLEEPFGLGTSDIKSATVTLPAGFVVNPGQASGLQACSMSAAGLEPLPGGGENDGPSACPSGSQIGTVLLRSPLIEGADEKQMEGGVYLLESNPPDIKLLVAASADGVNVKFVGTAHLDASTGQVTAVFEGTPQLPASLFKLTFKGDPHAALDTPPRCGTFSAVSALTPWGTPLTAGFTEGLSLGVVEGAGGAACPSGVLPFAPSLTAGLDGAQAGRYAGMSVRLVRGDGQQRVGAFQVTLPPGVSGAISHVPLCPEPQAAQGACPASSQVGDAVVSAGAGAYPLVLPQPGGPQIPVYLTGPYHGAPFGLSIVTPVLAGPFDLGSIVTRARLQIDPRTAQVTAISDPLPQIVDGVPTDIREIQVLLNHGAFTFNPTNCTTTGYSGTATGTGIPGTEEPSQQASLVTRSQVTGCRELAFKPKFTVSTAGKTTKANGASLKVKLAFPHSGPQDPSQDAEANIHTVHVQLPKALPARLTTLQQACTEQQFAANPAGCPTASIVGRAKVSTPILPVPLEGPAYFVSHGGAAFPELALVLQGDNVTIELSGETAIQSKTQVTSSTFRTVPDAPVSSFELDLPAGKYSALAAVLPAKARGSLCGQKLMMPITTTGQNGAVLTQSTKISISGCAKPKKKTKPKKKHHETKTKKKR